MGLKTIAVAVAMALALPAAAQEDLGLDLSAPTKKPAPKKKRPPKAPAPGRAADSLVRPNDTQAADSKKAAPAAPLAAQPAPLTAPPPATAPAAAKPAPAAAKPAPANLGLALDTGKAKPNKDLDLLDVPGFDDLDLKIAEDVSLCIFPFIKEDKLNEGSQVGGAAAKAAPKNLEAIQRIFYDVAKSSPLLKDATLLGKDAPSCGIEDTACIASIGNFNGCQAVLAGRSTREDNGFTLRARMVNAKAGKLMGKVNQVMATDDDNQVAAWAEGQACRALKVDCKATVTLDADRPEMKVLLDNRPLERKRAALGPETLTLSPGVYKIRVMIGQRNSREEVLAVRRGGKETVYARQLADGGIPLILASSMQKGAIPPKSVEVVGGRWTKPVGIVVASLGVVAAGFAGQQYLHSKSLVSDGNTVYTANGGAYYQQNTDKLTSANSSLKTSNVVGIAAAVLVVTGLALVFAF